MRLMFNQHLDVSELSYRTLKIFDLIADEIQKKSPNHNREDAIKLAKDVLIKAKVKPSSKNQEKSDALFFMSSKQAKNLADLALGDLEGKDVEKAVIQTLKSNNGIDLALFGRMVASNPEINCDASSQVAHAISTHRVENEYDYFTAVDDCSAEDNAGAGMIGTVEYNSATLYRYATVAVHELLGQLATDATAVEKALREFIRAFVLSMPTGKQNTFAAHSLPHTVMVALRSDRPLNLADAFEKPVKPKNPNDGFAQPSAKAFAERTLKAYEDFCTTPITSYIVGELPPELGQKQNIEAMINQAAKEASEKVMA